MAEKWLRIDLENDYVQLGKKGVLLKIADGEHEFGEFRFTRSGITWFPKGRGVPVACSWDDIEKQLRKP